MSQSTSQDYSVLLPPPQQEGGLIKMPKKNPEVAEHQFKVPDSLGNFFVIIIHIKVIFAKK